MKIKTLVILGIGLLPSMVLAGGVVTECSETALRAALAGGGIVTFACDGTIPLASPLTVTTDSTLDGSGHAVTLSGANAVPVCQMTNKVRLTLIHLTIAFGNGEQGAGVYNDRGTLNLTEVVFATNKVRSLNWTSAGGAVYSCAGVVNATNCTFVGNSASQPPIWNGLPAKGGALCIEMGARVYLEGCLFSGNSVVGEDCVPYSPEVLPGIGGFGGALYANGPLIVNHCTFRGNSAQGGKGCDQAYGHLLAGSPGGAAEGGAVFCALGASFRQSTFLHNACLGGTGGCGGWGQGDPAFGGPGGGGADGKGGAIASFDTLLLDNCTFASNSVTGGCGGVGGRGGELSFIGIGVIGGDGGLGGSGRGSALSVGASAHLVNCTFAWNTAAGQKGGQGGAGGDSGRVTAGGARGGPGGNGGNAWGCIDDAKGLLRMTNCVVAFNSGSFGAAGLGGPGGRSGGQCPVPYGPVGTDGTNGVALAGLATVGGSLLNTLLATNQPGGNSSATVTDAGHNISSDTTPPFTNGTSWNNLDPKLGSLADNGGPTLTLALLAGSPAIDAGASDISLSSDQRGVPRPLGAASDVGPFEYGCPAPTVAAPSPGQVFAEAVLEARGSGSDLVPLAGAFCQLNDQPWRTADTTNNWRDWTAMLNLAPGTNKVSICAVDSSGNRSPTNTVSFFYATPFLTVQISGNGTVTPNYSGRVLAAGKRYQMTAQPAADSLFVSWTDRDGRVLSASKQLAFLMQTSLVVRANFMLNPYLARAGNYAGLFQDHSAVSIQSAGYLSARLTAQGNFSAQLLSAGKTYPFSGSFGTSGSYAKAFPRHGQSALQLHLQLDPAGGDFMVGSISDGAWTAELQAGRATDTSIHPAAYTLVIPGGADAQALPTGHGFGCIKLDATGRLSLSGTLGDGTQVSQSSWVTRDGSWPLYCSLYGGKGLLFGWLGFANPPAGDIGGTVSWIKLPQPSAKLYPQGFVFDEGIAVSGGLYTHTNNTKLLSWNRGVMVLSGGNLPQPITQPVTLSTYTKVTGTNKLSLNLTSSSGLFRGSIFNPVTRKYISVNGVLLRKENAGYGCFLGSDQSGSVYLGPEP